MFVFIYSFVHSLIEQIYKHLLDQGKARCWTSLAFKNYLNKWKKMNKYMKQTEK